jgi:hypothetical protein
MIEELGTTVPVEMPVWKSSGSRASAWVCWDAPAEEYGRGAVACWMPLRVKGNPSGLDYWVSPGGRVQMVAIALSGSGQVGKVL